MQLSPDNSAAGKSRSLEELLHSGAAVKCANGLLLRSPKTSGTVLICALTDLDGTANDEHVPENDRLSTITPAREAFAILARSGIVTGICTARSSGEARYYQRQLNITGPLISENGAVVIFPDGSRKVFGDLKTLEAAITRINARLQRQIPNSIHYAGLEAAWEKEQRGETSVFLGHSDKKSLQLAADRCASCFLVGLSPGEKKIVASIAAEMGLSCFGELLHLIPQGANKGRALQALSNHLLQMPSEHDLRPDTVAQIVFGNGENDLPLFEQALKTGGTAVLVGDATAPNGFHFDISRHRVPNGTIMLRGVSHGEAILQSLPRLKEFFHQKYGLVFPW